MPPIRPRWPGWRTTRAPIRLRGLLGCGTPPRCPAAWRPALLSLPEGVDVVLSLCRVAKADLPRHAERIDIRLINQPAPYGVWVHGHNDTIGAATSVEKVATRLLLTKAADVLENVGSIDAEVRQQAYELGGTLAATLMK